MPNSQCLSLGGKQLIKWESSDFEVIVEDKHLEKEVDKSVCELEISEVMEGGKKAGKQFVKWQSSDFDVIIEDNHLEKEVVQSVSELEISEVVEEGKQFVRRQKSSDFIKGGRDLNKRLRGGR